MVFITDDQGVACTIYYHFFYLKLRRIFVFVKSYTLFFFYHNEYENSLTDQMRCLHTKPASGTSKEKKASLPLLRIK